MFIPDPCPNFVSSTVRKRCSFPHLSPQLSFFCGVFLYEQPPSGSPFRLDVSSANHQCSIYEDSKQPAAKSTFTFQSWWILRGCTPAVIDRFLYAALSTQHATCEQN